MRAAIVDTETTGHEPPEVIQLAYTDFEEIDSLFGVADLWYQPSRCSSFGALATHHILPEELTKFPSSSTCRLPSGVRYIIGHNVDYDWTALGKPDVKRICTMAIIRKLRPMLDSHTLGAVMYSIHLDTEWGVIRSALKDAHNAVGDVLLVVKFLQWLLRDRPDLRDPEKLWQFSEECRIPDIIAFGKHKGTHIKDLPYGYVQWMRRQPDMDEYVMKAVKRYHQ